MTQTALPPEVISELAPSGTIRLAANMANASIIAETGHGRYEGPVSEIATRLEDVTGLTVRIVPFASGGAILDQPALWDMAVLAVDPDRRQVRYLAEVAQVRATLACASDDIAQTCADADRPGARIATTRGAAYENHLLRSLTQAEVAPFPTPAAARAALLDGSCGYVAGIRDTLTRSLRDHPGLRLLGDDFLVVTQALAVHAESRRAADCLERLMRDQ